MSLLRGFLAPLAISGTFVAITFVNAGLADTTRLEVPGVLSSQAEAQISAPISARIVKMELQEGDRFGKGDRLVLFDCARLNAERRAARSELRSSEARFNVNLELASHDAIGSGDLAVSKAEVGAAAARVDALTKTLAYCEIKAPFAGTVSKRFVNQFETPTENQRLMRIQDNLAPKIELIAPSSWLRWLRIGTTFKFNVAETTGTFSARVVRIGAAVDPVSKSINVTAYFDGQPGGVLPGMSGRAVFRVKN